MNEKTIEVSGLSFTQVDIFGCYLPTRTSIESVLAKIPDKRNKRKICERSNKLAILHSRRFDIPDSFFDDWVYRMSFKVEETSKNRLHDLYKKSEIIMFHQCELAGLNPRWMAQSMFVMAWFDGMIGCDVPNNQAMRKVMGNMLKRTHSRSKSIAKHADVKLKRLTSREKEYPEYAIAIAMQDSFFDRTCLIAIYDVRMLRLSYNKIQITYEIFKILEGLKDKTCINVCADCRLHFESKKQPSIKICNSCKNRSVKQKKASRRLDRDGWVSVGTGKCGGGCESLKIKINTLGSCLKCYGSSS
jgi:hypothetical protein